MELQPTALVAMSGQGCRPSLVELLSIMSLDVRLVETCREARAFLGHHPKVDLVITQVSLPDGNWSDIVRYVVEHAEQASIVVTSAIADAQFWSEILWRGVYDLLIEPYDAYQVRGVVEGAIRRANRSNQQQISRKQANSASMGASASGRLFSRAVR